MAITVNPTWSDTASGVTHGLQPDGLNFGADFRIVQNDANELVITNLTTPIGYAERIRYQIKPIADVYANTTVDKALHSASRKGMQLYISLANVWKCADENDASFEMALPLSVALVVKFPQNALITEDIVYAEIKRFLGALYETDQTAAKPRLKALIRGSLKPKDL